MPHAVFNLGDQVATADLPGVARRLVPGIEPGGSRAGQDTKPALLLIDAWLEPINVQGSTAGFAALKVHLKLSQEQDLTPGLLLPVGLVGAGVTDRFFNVPLDLWHAQGTIWAPKWVGIRVEEIGTMQIADVDVHLDYEVVDVPFMDWFLMWEWLDGITDNSREY